MSLTAETLKGAVMEIAAKLPAVPTRFYAFVNTEFKTDILGQFWICGVRTTVSVQIGWVRQATRFEANELFQVIEFLVTNAVKNNKDFTIVSGTTRSSTVKMAGRSRDLVTGEMEDHIWSATVRWDPTTDSLRYLSIEADLTGKASKIPVEN